jgi:hypothetical protein
MRTTAIILMVFAMGLLITGCSKTTPRIETTQTNSDTSAQADITSDLTIDTTTANPDIGTLDDTAVSEELPQ